MKRTELGNGSDTILHPWWEVYQPVDYNLTSRMGNEQQFKSMVATCRRAGVKVYVDAVINHMTGQGHTSYGGVDFTKTAYVETRLAAYLNKLIGYGVSGFRVDAAKHIGQADLAALEARLRNTVDGTRPYIALECSAAVRAGCPSSRS